MELWKNLPPRLSSQGGGPANTPLASTWGLSPSSDLSSPGKGSSRWADLPLGWQHGVFLSWAPGWTQLCVALGSPHSVAMWIIGFGFSSFSEGKRHNDCSYLTGVFGELNEMIHAKHPSITVSGT